MNKGIIIGTFLALAFSIPAAAEFYRYKDAHGNTIYTDDYSKVPPDQRDEVESYVESISTPKADSEGAPPEAIQDDDEMDRMRLKQEQETLAKEYDGLTAEREALDRAQKAAVSKSQVKEYNKKVVEFNARIKAYEEKRDAYSIEVENFKKRMAEKESEKPAP